MIERAICEAAFRDAVAACDPAARVREALDREPLGGRIIAIAIGKAALAMARGAGAVERGLVVTNADDGNPLPRGWRLRLSTHPEVSEASVTAAIEVLALVESASSDDTVLALISGGASALVELPTEGLTLDELRERVRGAMASGMPIQELNRLRSELSALKGGKLAARALAPVVTLAVSDVIGDDPHVIGSGPTVRDDARVEVVAPMASFGEQVTAALATRGIAARRIAEPVADDVARVADRLAAEGSGSIVAWGEPTVQVPADHGRGGRAQQLALELARRLRGGSRSACVLGSDGIDGTAGPGEPVPAGAFVDGTTWDAIGARGVDPEVALRRCDAGTALAAVGALVLTGPTGINHADVIILG